MQDLAEHPTVHNAEKPPERSERHEALAIFLGRWGAEGTSYGGTDQSGDDPRANGEPWISTHEGRWHTGEFFLIQDEKALVGGAVFDTISVMGIDPRTDEYFAQTFENHGFERRYKVSREGSRWTFSGEHERATITFKDSDRTQDIIWEWKPADKWLPLCDRVARRTVEDPSG
jgi:hypothetical protein